MTARTMFRSRAWQGPAILSYGFRPFFLLGAIWAAAAMGAWLGHLLRWLDLSGPFTPTDWHAHAMLFGYASAVIAGFALTAVPNWTGRLPIVGWPLAGLVALWLIGRAATAVPGLPWAVAMLADLALPVVLVAALGREIAAGGNWRNLPVAGLVGLFALGQGVFHLQAQAGGAAQGWGLRLGLAAAVMLIALIGGRIVPSFTRNWLAARRAPALPAPAGRADAAALALTGAALVAFVVLPHQVLTAGLALMAGLANLGRLARWQGWRTAAEPLVWVLHAAFAFVGLGFLGIAAAAAGLMPDAGARHLWLAGAVGLMTLAVMTRASLGHTGRPLHATRLIAALYLALILSALARPAHALWPQVPGLLELSGFGWMLAFGGFAALFWPVLTRPGPGPKAAPGGR
ncbi:MAG TPA: NnrS family protein [Paracoccaceae bacterium]|nr:NnrS family protein [Paracoccaceae bacterium]